MSWKTFVRAGVDSVDEPDGRLPPPARASATRVSLRDGSALASASAASVGYISMNVCTTRGSSALPLSCRSRPIAASKLIAL